VSGADEKILRVFKAPKNFLENFHRINGADVTDALKKMVFFSVALIFVIHGLGPNVSFVTFARLLFCEAGKMRARIILEGICI